MFSRGLPTLSAGTIESCPPGLRLQIWRGQVFHAIFVFSLVHSIIDAVPSALPFTLSQRVWFHLVLTEKRQNHGRSWDGNVGTA